MAQVLRNLNQCCDLFKAQPIYEEEKMRSINTFAALKTAIAIGDEQSVKDLLPTELMVELEKSYLIDLAELNGNPEILELLEAIPVEK